MVAAWLRKDWEGVRRHAAEFVRLRPTYYHTYWHLAMALHRLGRDTEAVEPLGLYVKYAHEELEFPEAEALLKQLRTAAP